MACASGSGEGCDWRRGMNGPASLLTLPCAHNRKGELPLPIRASCTCNAEIAEMVSRASVQACSCLLRGAIKTVLG